MIGVEEVPTHAWYVEGLVKEQYVMDPCSWIIICYCSCYYFDIWYASKGLIKPIYIESVACVFYYPDTLSKATCVTVGIEFCPVCIIQVRDCCGPYCPEASAPPDPRACPGSWGWCCCISICSKSSCCSRSGSSSGFICSPCCSDLSHFTGVQGPPLSG